MRVYVRLLTVLPWLTTGQGLTWLLSPKDTSARHSTRDLTNASPDTTYDPYKNLRLCTNERVCVRRQFCDAHYGVCRKQLPAGQACRRDDMCERGLHCMFGECVERVARGKEGSRCHKDRDCDQGMCCARRKGQHICQRLQPQGHKCFVPEGGADYAINERCPCESGLICKYTSPDPPSADPAVIFWAAYENMLCVPPSHTPQRP